MYELCQDLPVSFVFHHEFKHLQSSPLSDFVLSLPRWSLCLNSHTALGRVHWLFTQAFWAILVLLNPILCRERGACCLPGLWRQTTKTGFPKRGSNERSNFSSLLPVTYPKWQSAVLGRDRVPRERRRGKKSGPLKLKWTGGEYVSTSFFCSLQYSCLNSAVHLVFIEAVLQYNWLGRCSLLQ